MARFSGGFIKVPRQVSLADQQNNPFFGEPLLLALYVILRAWANFEDGPLVKRGQVLTSQKELCTAMKLARQPTRGLLKKLETHGKINQRTNHQNTIITILDYDENGESWPNGQPTFQPTANQRPTNDQPRKEKERTKERKKLSPQGGEVIAALWTEHRGQLPGILELSKERLAKAQARWKQKPDPAFWEAVVKRLAQSEFAVLGSWATFDWLVKNAGNSLKVAEGNYDNRGQKPAPGGKSQDSAKFEDI